MSVRVKATRKAVAGVVVDATTGSNNFNADETFEVEVLSLIPLSTQIKQGDLYSTTEVEQEWEHPGTDGTATSTIVMHSGVIISPEVIKQKFPNAIMSEPVEGKVARPLVPVGTKMIVRPFIQGENSQSSGKGAGKGRLAFVKFK